MTAQMRRLPCSMLFTEVGRLHVAAGVEAEHCAVLHGLDRLHHAALRVALGGVARAMERLVGLGRGRLGHQRVQRNGQGAPDQLHALP